MMDLFENFRRRMIRRSEYRRTVAELRSLDRGTRRDLNISDSNIPAIARAAVYGQTS